jgi:hypothetical protein
MNIPRERIEGLPLSLSMEGSVIKFAARADQPLAGVLSNDGQTISGDYQVAGFVLPFTLRRTGEPRVALPPASAPIDKALEGTWTGALSSGGASLRVVLTLLNQPDGTATGTMVVVDQGNLRLPVTFRQEGSGVTIDIKAVGATFSGTLSGEGAELSGTYQQGSITAPLAFQRARVAGR